MKGVLLHIHGVRNIMELIPNGVLGVMDLYISFLPFPDSMAAGGLILLLLLFPKFLISTQKGLRLTIGNSDRIAIASNRVPVMNQQTR